jgi:hypothetical protein
VHSDSNPRKNASRTRIPSRAYQRAPHEVKLDLYALQLSKSAIGADNRTWITDDHVQLPIMAAVPKPDSSHASNRITRSNGPPRHLLRTFNNPESGDTTIAAKSNAAQLAAETRPDPGKDDEPMSSEEEDLEQDIAQPSVEAGFDVATDAEPLSSDEEQPSDDESLPGRRNMNYMVTTTTLEEKLAQENNASQGSSQVRNGRTRRGSFIRKHSTMTGSDDEDDFIFSGCSQPKRRKGGQQYASKNSKTGSFNNQHLPRQQETKEPSPVSGDPEEPEETFIVPRNIESPTFKASRGGEESNSSFSHGQYSIEDYEAVSLDGDSPLSSLSFSICDEMSDSDEKNAKKDRQPSPPPKSLCPMCHEEVDWELLEKFKAQPKQRIREQVQFCESHNRQSAAESWEQRGYPQIDWDLFEERVQSYFPKLEKLLVPGVSSFYRNILDTALTSGQSKNLRLTAENSKGLEMMSCGYYGARGSTKMYAVSTSSLTDQC